MDNPTRGSTTTHLPLSCYVGGSLIVTVYTVWQYLMGHYGNLPLPATLVFFLVVATLLRSLGPPPFHRIATMLALAGAYLLTAVTIYRMGEWSTLWLGFSVILTFLALPLAAAWTVNLLLAPLWLVLMGDSSIPPVTLLTYLSLLLFGTLVPWEQNRLRARLYTSNQYDPSCDALHSGRIRERLAAEVARTQMLERPLSVLVIHLTQYDMAHEQFGSRLSHVLIQRFCHTAQHTCRGQDSLGRADDSVFWLLLPNTGENGALMVKNRLISALDTTVLPETGPIRADILVSRPRPEEDPTEYCHRLDTQGIALKEHMH
ncbi:GGDEF domain-containing protein [Aidingimonas halophila]|uniref:GGDEF domain-containing protein, diguanylate cyclase (C-di-GMP synthetase) or its enzymatically inactive variants n=1 Tax=Aidingimonas halophila TaxID=574349 RepID=A0A1H3AZS4_9GAMM|nr:diguanylate cyclase [Aidingimonas halophila]GHC25541.1 hypothetical protein GCM10008094_15740 [Aidingimonas halophila]SDX34319.1 GGDEF domain-containing protein, diguanylate cyclase (c-di-GMP synthetase) or its enzymatically inactive variants [Aidingimonas halophila]